MTGSARVRDGVSWWLVSELARRHPELTIIQTHPGGGQYDCLAVVDPRDAGPNQPPTKVVDINRAGSIHLWQGARAASGSDDENHDDWMIGDWVAQVLDDENPHALVKELEARLGLTPPERTPPTTRRTLTFRLLAAAAWTNVHRKDWRPVRSALLDASDYVGLDVDPAQFGDASERLEQRERSDVLGEPAYRFWVLPGGTGEVLLETTATAWRTGGSKRDLFADYTSGRSIASLTAELTD